MITMSPILVAFHSMLPMITMSPILVAFHSQTLHKDFITILLLSSLSKSISLNWLVICSPWLVICSPWLNLFPMLQAKVQEWKLSNNCTILHVMNLQTRLSSTHSHILMPYLTYRFIYDLCKIKQTQYSNSYVLESMWSINTKWLKFKLLTLAADLLSYIFSVGI